MSPKRKLSAAKRGTPKKARKDSTASKPPTRHSRRQAGEAPEVSAQNIVETPRQKRTSPIKTKNTTHTSTPTPNPAAVQSAQSVQAPVPTAVGIATFASEAELPGSSNVTTAPAASSDANPIALNEVAQSTEGITQNPVNTTNETPVPQPLSTEPTREKPTSKNVEPDTVQEYVPSSHISDLKRQLTHEDVSLTTELPGSQEAPESIRDTVHDAISEVKVVSDPADESPGENISSPDLASASRELLQQAAEHPALQEPSVQAPVTQKLINDAHGPPLHDTAKLLLNTETKDTSGLETSNATADVPKAETHAIDLSPKVKTAPSLGSLHESGQETSLDESEVVQAHNGSPKPPIIAEDAETWGLPDDFDQELFGDDLSPLDAENTFIRREATVEAPSTAPTVAPPPTPATPATQVKSTPTIRPFKDLMSLRAEDREAEAKYQIATEAGLTVRDYSEKVGKDVFRKQAKDLVRQRVLEDQEEGKNFFKELNEEPFLVPPVLKTSEALVTAAEHEEDQRPGPVLETSGAPMTTTQKEDSDPFDRYAELAELEPKSIYRPLIKGDEVYEVDKPRKKPRTKHYAGGVKKMDELRTSLLVEGSETEGRKRKYDDSFTFEVSTEVANLTSTVKPQYAVIKSIDLEEDNRKKVEGGA